MISSSCRTIRLASCFAILAGLASFANAQGPTPSDDGKVLADQVRQLMEMNQALSRQLGDLSNKYDELAKKVGDLPRPSTNRSPGGAGGPDGTGDGSPNPPSQPAGGGSSGGIRNPESAQGVGNRRLGKLKVAASYDHDRDGFLLATEDDEFQLKIRTLIQADAHIFQQHDQDPVRSGFYLPRGRMYLSGRITKPIEYQVAFQRNYDSFDLLNAYINYNYDDRLAFRVGRYKSPYTYEYYKVEVQNLLAPERSLYNLAFQGNRQIGAMAYGQVVDKKLEYAVGAFNGGRNSFQPFTDSVDLIAFLNYRPFKNDDDSILKNLNVGGSVDYGLENNPTVPSVFRTSSQVSSAAINSTGATNTGNVPFFAFKNNVRESGRREEWELHAAYFRKGLSLLGAWDSGSNSYALTTKGASPVSVGTGGYFVQAAYLITGETRNDNGLIDPLRPFDPRPVHFGWGAIEPTARFSTIRLDRRVFDAGFADPNLWANSAYATDIGVNWYLNKYAKVYFEWQHSVFGNPVTYRPGFQQLTSDLFWLRFQLYF